MSGDKEYGFCSVCLKQGNVSRTYFKYDVKCECHSPNHFEIVWHCEGCEPEEPKTTQITLRTDLLTKIIDLK